MVYESNYWGGIFANVSSSDIWNRKHAYPQDIEFPRSNLLKSVLILGLALFKGEVFHSTRWRDGVSLKGKKVVVVGNNSPSLIGNVACEAESVTVIGCHHVRFFSE